MQGDAGIRQKINATKIPRNKKKSLPIAVLEGWEN